MSETTLDWPGLTGPPQPDSIVELAERLTGALEELEVVRLLAEEVERRVRPTHWCLLLGDRDTVRIEHVGGQTSASLLRRTFDAREGLVWTALESYEAHVVRRPARADLVCLSNARGPDPEDAVAIPFGGYEVVGCLEMVDVLRLGPAHADLTLLRRALRLGGVGLRNARRHRELSRGDSIDEITGLAGPNRFRAALQQEIARARRSHRPIAVMLVDLDHFAKVNQSQGRLVGSSLLAEVGAIVQLSIRNVDLASRWSGDTFALLLPDTDREGASAVASRIQQRLRTAHLLDATTEPSCITASVGIAVLDEHVDDPERAIHDAESVMRAAQAAGDDETVTFAR